MSYDNTNTGFISKNDRKEKETHPDIKGSMNVDGVEYWVAGWHKVGGEGTKMAGKKFYSLSLTPKEEKPAATVSGNSFKDMEDDIPF